MPTRSYRKPNEKPPSWLAEYPFATTNQHTAPHPASAEADSSTFSPTQAFSRRIKPFVKFECKDTDKNPNKSHGNQTLYNFIFHTLFSMIFCFYLYVCEIMYDSMGLSNKKYQYNNDSEYYFVPLHVNHIYLRLSFDFSVFYRHITIKLSVNNIF